MGKITDFFKKTWEENKAYYAQLEPQEQMEKDVSPAFISKSVTEFCPENYIIYYCYGHVVRIIPEPQGCYYDNRDIIYGATTIISDGVRYDLTDKKSIYSIAIPSYHIHSQNRVDTELGTTGYLEYTLRMRAGRFWNEKNFDLAIACLGKATQLMKYSSMGWPKKDFYRIVDWLEQLGRFEKAKEWEAWIERNVPSPQDDAFNRVLGSALELGTDLVYAPWSGGQSAVTAKYQGRVYSLSGENSMFPTIPEFMRGPQSICHILCPFVFYNDKKSDTIYYKGKNVHAIKASWRPFVDDRSQEDKDAYSSYVLTQIKQREAAIAKHVYYKLKYLIPDDIPKSLGAFSRMKNANTESYRQLVKKAELAGFNFPQMTVSIEEPIDPEPNYNGGRRKPFFHFL